MHTQIVGGGHLFYPQHRRAVIVTGVEGQIGHPGVGRAVQGPGDVDDIRHHRGSRGLVAGTGTVKQGGTDGIALDHHRVHHAVHFRHQGVDGNQCRVYPYLHTLLRLPGDTQVLDAEAELPGIGHVLEVQIADALGIDLFKLQGNTEGQGGQDHQLMGGVGAVHVKGRVRLGIAQHLGLLQGLAEGDTPLLHGGEDIVAGAVDNARQPLDAVGPQAFPQCLDNGDAAGNGTLEHHHHRLLAGGLEYLVAVLGDQGWR